MCCGEISRDFSSLIPIKMNKSFAIKASFSASINLVYRVEFFRNDLWQFHSRDISFPLRFQTANLFDTRWKLRKKYVGEL